MNGFVTTDRYQTIYDLPIQLPQMELRRGRYIVCGAVKLVLGQVMRVRCFNLHLINIITPDNTPDIFSTPLGLVSAGVFMSPMLCSGAVLMRCLAPGVAGFNSFQYRDFATPGIYYFAVSNNTRNIDLTVALTGVAKIFNG
jgi:hypothetical protein